MFDIDTLRLPLRPDAKKKEEEQQDRFAQRCREPAELWALKRRQNRPVAVRSRLPRAVAS